jgi:hypothetical protein
MLVLVWLVLVPSSLGMPALRHCLQRGRGIGKVLVEGAACIGLQEGEGIGSGVPDAVVITRCRFRNQRNQASSRANVGVAGDRVPGDRVGQHPVAASRHAAGHRGQAWRDAPLVAIDINDAAELAVVGGVLNGCSAADAGRAGEGPAVASCEARAVGPCEICSSKDQRGLVDVGTRVVVVPLGRIGRHIHPGSIGGRAGNRVAVGVEQRLGVGQGQITDLRVGPDRARQEVGAPRLAQLPNTPQVVGWSSRDRCVQGIAVAQAEGTVEVGATVVLGDRAYGPVQRPAGKDAAGQRRASRAIGVVWQSTAIGQAVAALVLVDEHASQVAAAIAERTRQHAVAGLAGANHDLGPIRRSVGVARGLHVDVVRWNEALDRSTRHVDVGAVVGAEAILCARQQCHVAGQQLRRAAPHPEAHQAGQADRVLELVGVAVPLVLMLKIPEGPTMRSLTRSRGVMVVMGQASLKGAG